MLYDIPRCATLQRVVLDSTTDHIAKNKAWERNLYDSLGWCTMPPAIPQDETVLAVGMDWVFVGDCRRTSHVGCGGLIVRDAGLYKAFESRPYKTPLAVFPERHKSDQ